MLDEVFKKASFTAVLNSDASTIRKGANAGEFLVAKLSMDGLKDYARNDGYTKGDVKLEWETLKYNYDRGILFQVDSMDNEETVGLSFGKLGAEFQRTQVAPEADAFCLSTLAQETGISSKEEAAAFADGEAVLDALREAMNQMDEDEVPAEQRYLFITPTLYRMASSVVTYVNKGVLDAQQVVGHRDDVRKHPHAIATEKADGHAVDHQQRHHQHKGRNAGQDEVAGRVDAHDFQRVYLLGDAHRADFRRDVRAHLPGQDEAHDSGRELQQQRIARHQPGGVGGQDGVLRVQFRLYRHDGPDEHRNDNHDGQRLQAQLAHLPHKLPEEHPPPLRAGKHLAHQQGIPPRGANGIQYKRS